MPGHERSTFLSTKYKVPLIGKKNDVEFCTASFWNLFHKINSPLGLHLGFEKQETCVCRRMYKIFNVNNRAKLKKLVFSLVHNAQYFLVLLFKAVFKRKDFSNIILPGNGVPLSKLSKIKLNDP